jgi:hypothetical protein
VATPQPTTAPAVDARRAAEAPPAIDLQRAVEIGELGERLGAVLRRGTRFQSLSVQLHPAELGSVKVEARLVDGITHLVFSPESGASGERIASALHDLRQQMTRAGVQVGDLDVRQGPAGGSGAWSDGDPGNRSERTSVPAGTRRVPLTPTRAPSTDAAFTSATTSGAHVALDL